jgi:hypothetical protein
MASHGTSRISNEMQQCINECLNCHSICLQTVAYCLQQGGQHAEANHVTTLLACAEICRTSAGFMLLGTELHKQTCAACAEVCARCAESCEQTGDDAQMKACAEACRRCAESCRRMAAGA